LRREIGELKVKIADKDAEIAKRAADSSSKVFLIFQILF